MAQRGTDAAQGVTAKSGGIFEGLRRLVAGKKGETDNEWIDLNDNSDIHVKPGTHIRYQVGPGISTKNVNIFGPPKVETIDEETNTDDDHILQTGVSRLTGVYGDDVFAQMQAELRRHGKAAIEDFRRLLLKTAGDNVENSKDFQELVEEGNAILVALE
jgi:hypothetical protein